MIGLGSNRLSVCRRGGMSVTQAGKGGMEWLAGGRGPSWASPYSAQATAALKDAFSAAQWQTIRDYGFAHPALVPFINEDPMLVCSLMELGKIRWLVGDGDQWIDTGYAGTDDSVFKILIKNFTLIRGNVGFQGKTSGVPRYGIYASGSNVSFMFKQNGAIMQSIDTNAHVYRMGYGFFTKDGVAGTTVSDSGNTTDSTNLAIFRTPRYVINGNGKASMDISYWEAEGEIKLVPFVSTARNGMLDIHDLEHPVFHENKGTGTFGTEITDSPS